MSAIDSKEQKRLRQAQTALVFEDVGSGLDLFQSICARNLDDHTIGVLRELVRVGDFSFNQTLAQNLLNQPLRQCLEYTIDCFEHALHTKQNPEICALWRDQLLQLTQKIRVVEIKNSLLNGLKFCAMSGNSTVGNALLFTLLPSKEVPFKNQSLPSLNEILNSYFGAAPNDPSSIENVCTTLFTQLNSNVHLKAMGYFFNELNRILVHTPSKIGRKEFKTLTHCMPARYRLVFNEMVWARCLQWCDPQRNAYQKTSIDYMLYYASQNGDAQQWERVMSALKSNPLVHNRSINHSSIETCLDLIDRMKATADLMDEYSSIVRSGLRDVFTSVGPKTFTYSRDKEVWARLEATYAAFEKSELLQHIGHTQKSVSDKNTRKM